MAAILPYVDRAGFAVSFATRLRTHGVAVGPTEIADLVGALNVAFPQTRSQLYWLARITLVTRHADISVFDQVFAAVFDDAVLAMDPQARRRSAPDLPASAGRPARPVAGSGEALSALPWVSLRDVQAADDSAAEHGVPQLAPSSVPTLADVPFGELDQQQMAMLADWLRRTAPAWPNRRRRRTRPNPHRGRIALRRTLSRARRTGFEPVRLEYESPCEEPRKVVLICDVSQSMQAESLALLHLTRAMVLHREAEVFAFSTRLHRVTEALRHRSPQEAVSLVSDRVTDRFGGTRIAECLRSLLDSRHAGLLRGAVVVIGSDGWDADPPEAMAREMARLARRAHSVVWLNPRAGADGFSPDVGGMAAALPFVDRLLPAGSFTDLRAAVTAVAETGALSSRSSRGSRAGTARR